MKNFTGVKGMHIVLEGMTRKDIPSHWIDDCRRSMK